MSAVYASALMDLLGGVMMLAVVMALLRWAVGTGRTLPNPKVVDPDDPTGDGLLVEVARLPTDAAAQVLQSRLRRTGIRATIRGDEAYGFRLLVFDEDGPSARIVLR
jgi:hypothetical protein